MTLVPTGSHHRDGCNLRCSVVSLIPACRQLVRFKRPLDVANIVLQYLAHILLVLCCSSKVALFAVLADSYLETPDSILGVLFPIDLEGVNVRVRGVVGLLEVVCLYGSGFFKSRTGFAVYGIAQSSQFVLL